jgi:lipopolysaccharide export system protein LptA
MRTVVLAAGVLLVVALAVFLAVGKWKNPFNRRDLPKRLGIEIQQEASGVTYTQAHGGRTLFKIHASRVIQLKKGYALLHDVKIELYGEDGSRVDRIEGDEFEYDQQLGTAKATGPVEITLMRPGVAPAIAPKATPGQAVGHNAGGKPLATAADAVERGEIHVKTSGVTFDQNSGLATTPERVEFSMAQGNGSAIGATYDSQRGLLALERAVELNTRRGGETVEIHAQHAEFERGDQDCHLRGATADYRDGEATAGEAKIVFRADGSAVRMDASNGVMLATATGSHLAAASGSLEFDEHSQPRHGHLDGGVTMDSASQAKDGNRQMHGSSPAAELEFTAKGELRHAHLERGVEFESQEQSESAAGSMRMSRRWKSPAADLEFRAAGHGQVEPETMHGTGGVVITGESQRGKGPVTPFKLAADELTGQFGPKTVLTAMTGLGHASFEQTTATGSRQTTSGDRIEAHFAAGGATGAKVGARRGEGGGLSGATQIQSATVDGHVALIQEPAARPVGQAQAQMRATAGRAVYEGAGEWLHLTQSPRVEDGNLQLTAEKIDVSRETGDAFAHGNVKATWAEDGAGKSGAGKNGQPGSAALGGQGPAHVIAAEAQLRQAQGASNGEATFRGHARLWQQSNSIDAPVIVLDRQKQTLMGHSTEQTEPVRVVLVSAGGPIPGKEGTGKPATPSVIRIRGGDLKYSDAERKAVMQGGAAGSVVAETSTATSVSSEVEVVLLPQGNHAGKDGGGAQGAQVDRMTARGHVVVTSGGRRGTGEQLVYSSENGEYVLTGTAAAPPRMSDPARGSVTGEALIFHSRDDSVSIEGGGRKTTTETTAPR